MMRLHPRPRARAGITLTEILISIMIMGIGLLSLATLFPLGLLRIREANRASRSGRLIESAMSDMQARNLLNKQFFSSSWYGLYDPFTFDPVNPLNPNPNPLADGGAYHPFGKGLTVAYDPLWWYEAYLRNNSGAANDPTLTPLDPRPEIQRAARFASGIGFVRDDPNPGQGSSLPSAHGLQRLTNWFMLPEVEKIFASNDDLVYQSEGTASPPDGTGSPLVPDLSAGTLLADLSYTWIFTGRQNDVTNHTVFEGDIVVFHNRPFNVEPTTSPLNGSTIWSVPGETVVEAVFGYGPSPKGGGYSINNNTVLLRWPAGMPDPDVRVGGWIADVTYERYSTEAYTRFDNAAFANPFNGEIYPAQRCYWYRVTKRSDVTVALPFQGDPTNYRQMVVTIDTPVRAKTYLTGAGQPYHVNAALASPFVVNVVPRTFYVR